VKRWHGSYISRHSVITCKSYNDAGDRHLVDIAQDLASDVFATSLLVVENSRGSGQDDDAEPTSGEEQVDPGLDLCGLDVETRGDDTGLVQTTIELDDDLAGSVVVDLLELANVAMSLHDPQVPSTTRKSLFDSHFP